MRFFIFDFQDDAYLIENFLKSAAIAHGHNAVKDKEWFLWKFRDNPFGETILACAEEDGEIAGCVAYGIQPFQMGNKTIKGALAFENFVHPKWRRRGLFKKLISLSEKETLSRGIEILFVFPNAQSLQGYLSVGWTQTESTQYLIRPYLKARSLLKLKDIRKSFVPNESNLNQIIPISTFQQQATMQLQSVITKEYLNWRFFTYPVSEYFVIENKAYQSIVRVGKRGTVKEAQVLMLNITDENKFKLKHLLTECKKGVKYDLISFPISKHNSLRNLLLKHLFFRVPSRGNTCYKILDYSKIDDYKVQHISLSAINAHTY